MKKNIICIMVSLIIIIPEITKADTYNTTENLFENSYTNNLIDMAQTQIDNIENKNYVILRQNEDYYMITTDKKNTEINNNKITMNNTKIVRAVRTNSGYNYVYNYDTKEETSTTININNIIISNINTNKSISSSRLDNYIKNKYNNSLLIFILGILFAIFITRERTY